MICSGPIRDNLAVARRPGVDIIDVKTTKQQATDRAVTILGPVLAIAVAWATATLRSDMSIANAALALAFVCVAAAAGPATRRILDVGSRRARLELLPYRARAFASDDRRR